MCIILLQQQRPGQEDSLRLKMETALFMDTELEFEPELSGPAYIQLSPQGKIKVTRI